MIRVGVLQLDDAGRASLPPSAALVRLTVCALVAFATMTWAMQIGIGVGVGFPQAPSAVDAGAG
ncbi:MAG: hypothetical protein IPI67_11770 [Myxococcales bacterium]|nr:hypothetical protein [Myxococcales bacterium]